MILTCRGKTLQRIGLDKPNTLIGRNELCDIGMVLENGQATVYEDLDEAIARHEENMLGAPVRESKTRLGTPGS